MDLFWKSINVGEEIPSLEKRPDVTQLIKYASGSGDFNPLHHDYSFPQSKLLGSIIVHGRFKYAALGELVSNWLGHRGYVRKLTCQYRGMDFPDEMILCRGCVLRKWEENGEKLVELQIWSEKSDGKITTPGSAIVILKS